MILDGPLPKLCPVIPTSNQDGGAIQDHSTKVWLQLAQWFLRRRLLCEFPIGSYVKLSSAVGKKGGMKLKKNVLL
jgi:hypothetical protein